MMRAWWWFEFDDGDEKEVVVWIAVVRSKKLAIFDGLEQDDEDTFIIGRL